MLRDSGGSSLAAGRCLGSPASKARGRYFLIRQGADIRESNCVRRTVEPEGGVLRPRASTGVLTFALLCLGLRRDVHRSTFGIHDAGPSVRILARYESPSEGAIAFLHIRLARPKTGDAQFAQDRVFVASQHALDASRRCRKRG